jgi:prepilin-type N-terminal cleavage/methylation domain-containing protein
MRLATARLRQAARTTRRSRSGQAGLTLIEMVVAIAIIAIGVVGIAYGFSAVVRSAGDAQGQATLDAAAQTVADYLQSDTPPLTYLPCVAHYAVAAPSGFTTAYPHVLVDGYSWPLKPINFPVNVSMANSTLGYPSLKGSATCAFNQADYGVQEITFTVSEGSSSVSRTVWKGATP